LKKLKLIFQTQVQTSRSHKRLNLYKIENGEKTLVKGIEFNTIYLPAEDRERLKKGIKLEDIEDGYELIEDFIS